MYPGMELPLRLHAAGVVMPSRETLAVSNMSSASCSAAQKFCIYMTPLGPANLAPLCTCTDLIHSAFKFGAS